MRENGERLEGADDPASGLTVVGGKGAAPVRLTLLGLFESSPPPAAAIAVSARARAVLAVLALQLGRPVSRDKLAEMIWPLSGLGPARQSLRQAIKTLRDAFAACPGFAIERDATAGSLLLRGLATDVAELEAQARAPLDADASQIRKLYRGVFLEDFPDISAPFEAWLTEERARLTALAGNLFQARAAAAMTAGDWENAIVLARDAVRIDPLREDGHRQLMQAYAGAGRGSEALNHFEDLTRLLKAELGVAPDPATRDLAAEIKAASTRGAQRPAGSEVLKDVPSPEMTGASPSAVPVGLLSGTVLPPVKATAARSWLLPLLVIGLLAIGLAGLVFTVAESRNAPDERPTYTVAPFKVIGTGDSGATLANALTTRLSNGISGIPTARLVVSATERSAANFRVEGSVTPSPAQVEVQAWIVDTKTGEAFGRTTYKAPPGEGPEAQTLILGRIGDDLSVAINRKAYPPPDSTADHKRARQLAQEARLRIDRKSGDIHSTFDLFRQAIRLSPDDFEIGSWFANALVAEGSTGRISERDRDALNREATELIDATLQRAPHHRLALYARCQLLRITAKPHAAFAACADTNKVLPWSARIHKEVGFIRLALGDLEGALLNFDAADSLERQYSVRWTWKWGAGLVLMLADRNEEAKAKLREAIKLHEDSFNSFLVLAVACHRTGDTACVETSVAQFRAQTRQLEIGRIMNGIVPAANPYSADVAQRIQRFKAEAMKLLGDQG